MGDAGNTISTTGNLANVIHKLMQTGKDLVVLITGGAETQTSTANAMAALTLDRVSGTVIYQVTLFSFQRQTARRSTAG